MEVPANHLEEDEVVVKRTAQAEELMGEDGTEMRSHARILMR